MPNTAIIITNGYRNHKDFLELTGVDLDSFAMHGLFVPTRLGFQVVVLRDLDDTTVLGVIDEHTELLVPGDTLVIYFAGHAHKVDGKHVLVFPNARQREIQHLRGIIPVELLRDRTVRPGVASADFG